MLKSLSLIFLSCNTPWVTALARALSQTHRVVALGNRPLGQAKGRHLVISSQRDRTDRFEWREWVFPPGYAGRLEPLFRPWIQRRVRDLTIGLERECGSPPVIVAPYPYNWSWLGLVLHCPVVYYNLDDYRLYDPGKAAKVEEMEQMLLDQAQTTLCLSSTQTKRLAQRARNPQTVHHFPLGVLPEFVQPDPPIPVRPGLVNYVGGLDARVDWRFVREVAQLCPSLTFQFVGGMPEGKSGKAAAPSWQHCRAEALSLPNVTQFGPIPQQEIHQWTWSAAVNWIPYDTRHPFNQASCPTKIMDYLAAGRPVLSTPVPECVLYPDFIHIEDDPQLAAQWLQQTSAASAPDQAMIAFAKGYVWHHRADTFMRLM